MTGEPPPNGNETTTTVKKPDKPEKDIWDKIGVISGFLGSVVIAGVGLIINSTIESAHNKEQTELTKQTTAIQQSYRGGTLTAQLMKPLTEQDSLNKRIALITLQSSLDHKVFIALLLELLQAQTDLVADADLRRVVLYLAQQINDPTSAIQKAVAELDKKLNTADTKAATNALKEKNAKIVQIETPEDSSDSESWPKRDKIWSIEFPAKNPSKIGIGHVVDSGCKGKGEWSSSEFAMHNHRMLPNSQIPDPNFATITYTFDVPTTVSGLKVLQHRNGVTKIVGYVAETPEGGWTQLGESAVSRVGDVRKDQAFPHDGFEDTFKFSNPKRGKLFRFLVQKTSEARGFAFFGACPLNVDEHPFEIAGQATAKASP
jgi:hypothetical protein